MQYSATLNYSERIVSRAVRQFWMRAIGIGGIVGAVLTIAFLVWLIMSGDRSWVVGLVGACVLLSIGMPLALYLAHYRSSMGKFRQMQRPVGEFTVDDEKLTLSSELGTSTLAWSGVTEVWRFKTFWLLLISKSQFVTIPLEDVPEEMQVFVLDKVKAAGGKVPARAPAT